MQEIRDLKTRDHEILSESIREFSGIKKGEHVWDLSIMFELIKKIPVDTYLIYSKELQKWVFTDLLDDDLIFQEFFNDMNFVIVENDLSMALARGIHYRFNKKVRP